MVYYYKSKAIALKTPTLQRRSLSSRLVSVCSALFFFPVEVRKYRPCHSPSHHGLQRLGKLFAADLDLLLRERRNPKAPLDDALDRLKFVFRTGVNQSQKTFHDLSCRAIAFEVDQRLAITGCHLGRLLCIVCKIVDIQTYSTS